MDMAHSIAKRSYDPKYKVGAIVVSADNTSVLALGYNGNFAGGPNRSDSLEQG
jgi:deoxycytidylate deaminase